MRIRAAAGARGRRGTAIVLGGARVDHKERGRRPGLGWAAKGRERRVCEGGGREAEGGRVWRAAARRAQLGRCAVEREIASSAKKVAQKKLSKKILAKKSSTKKAL